MSNDDSRKDLSLVIGGIMLIGACIMLAGLVVAEAVSSLAESSEEGGSLGMTVFTVAMLFLFLGVGGLYRAHQNAKK